MIKITHTNNIKHLFAIDTECVLCEIVLDSRSSLLVPKVWDPRPVPGDPLLHFCSGYSEVSCFVKNNRRTSLTSDMFISHDL